MQEPKSREKFWITDPPFIFEDEENGVVLIGVFSNRGKLKDYYNAHDLWVSDNPNLTLRRYGRLKQDCSVLGWSGLAIDPDPESGVSRIIIFKSPDH